MRAVVGDAEREEHAPVALVHVVVLVVVAVEAPVEARLVVIRQLVADALDR